MCNEAMDFTKSGGCIRGDSGGIRPPQNLHSGGIAPTNKDNVPTTTPRSKGLYCSHRKPYKAFQ